MKRSTFLWLGAFFFFVIGDAVTTVMGLDTGASESNPVFLSVLESYGVLGAMALKLSPFPIAAFGYWFADGKVKLIYPGVLCAIGIFLTFWNSLIILALTI